MEYILYFGLACGIAFLSIPALIRVASEKNLYDTPDNLLKQHQRRTPTLGGVAIFGAVMITFTLSASFQDNPTFSYALAALFILFFTGVKDDIIPLTPYKKVVAQLLASCILIFWSDIRLTSFHGFFFLGELPYWVSVGFSMLTFLVIINSFNLLDGINGLAGGIGLLVSLLFAVLFFISDNMLMVSASMSLAGALLGFLYYNFRKKAYIFMGDTGSLIIGAFFSIFAFTLIETNQAFIFLFRPNFIPALAFSILIIPLFDTLRVIILRILYRKSPFQGDRQHLHHFLLDIKFTHLQASTILYVANLMMVGVILNFRQYPELGLMVIIMIGTLLSFWLHRVRMRVQNQLRNQKEKIQYAQE